ncbi:MAG TPA: hypothetical protein VN026_10900 [Bacteroidia bacterium]|jgi:hypothetical protein|nr:hypothetical protein [Bacteroidia bacterium]
MKIFVFILCFCFDWSTFWTALTAIATFWLVIVARGQLKKINSQNSISILFNLEGEWNSKFFRKKRKFLAQGLQSALDKPETLRTHTTLKSQIADIFIFFEKVAVLANKDEIDVDLVYNTYSYHIKYFWEIAVNIGYITQIREEPTGYDFFIEFENLYKSLSKKNGWKEFSKVQLLKFCEEEANIDEEGNMSSRLL